jgi:hypothetical protein
MSASPRRNFTAAIAAEPSLTQQPGLITWIRREFSMHVRVPIRLLWLTQVTPRRRRNVRLD